jgi:DNA-binding MarR family transcriptional regulator
VTHGGGLRPAPVFGENGQMEREQSEPKDLHARVAPDDSLGRITAWQNLLLASHLLDTVLERQAQRDGDISHGHFKLLVLLDAAQNQALGLKALAEALRFSFSRVSHAITTLEKNHLVTRRVNIAGGRRTAEAVLTPEGRQVVRRVLRAQRDEIREPLFDALGDRQTAALGRICADLIKVIDNGWDLRPV